MPEIKSVTIFLLNIKTEILRDDSYKRCSIDICRPKYSTREYEDDPLAVKVGDQSRRGVEETRLTKWRIVDAEEQVSDSGGEIHGNLKRTYGNNEK
ncbi:hypothetical protein CEXT_462721 [Caerostris extrusa]|uniref:Uncharacterized protein n=1 Tax=Caerostris extrusa TaxID=172846 RepID=A0AAV4TZM9_CAEEX|nr:hypothetical protein CEXT_462721 [Caerostris extrusa]